MNGHRIAFPDGWRREGGQVYGKCLELNDHQLNEAPPKSADTDFSGTSSRVFQSNMA